MPERTEEDKVLQTGIKVKLGGRDYEIRPLSIKYSSEWRKKSIPLIVHLMRFSQKNKPEEMEKAISELFTVKLDEIIDSFLDYARDLDKEKIAETATDGEIMVAFMEVFNEFVAPFGKVPPEMIAKLSQ
jgi:hypothetical protein